MVPYLLGELESHQRGWRELFDRNGDPERSGAGGGVRWSSSPPATPTSPGPDQRDPGQLFGVLVYDLGAWQRHLDVRGPPSSTHAFPNPSEFSRQLPRSRRVFKMSAWRLFLASWVVLSVTTAEAGELQFRERFSGSLVNTTIDTNRDGFPGYLATVAGTSSLGAISIQDATELAPSGTCPNGDLRLTLVAGHS